MAPERKAGAFASLPDELVDAVVWHLPPRSTLAFGKTNKRHFKITSDSLVWRKHCIDTWRYWQPEHKLCDKLSQPPGQIRWRGLFRERAIQDKRALAVFEQVLAHQQSRYARMDEVARLSHDVKDLLLRLADQTGDEVKDCLARRWYADAILSQIHRRLAVDTWTRLQQDQPVLLEEALAAYDSFVLKRTEDLDSILQEFDRLAQEIRDGDNEWQERSVQFKAMRVAVYLRSMGLVGNADTFNCHALRNNFISLALFKRPHTSLPLQSVAIYCAVARRLGIDASPSNYPDHVHSVIKIPSELQDRSEATVHFDPWRSSEEVPRSQLTRTLEQMGLPPNEHSQYLGAAPTFDICRRTAQNIMNSVQQALSSLNALQYQVVGPRTAFPYIDENSAWYGTLFALLILGESSEAAYLQRRRSIAPSLMEYFQEYFPQDLFLIEATIVPLFKEYPWHRPIYETIQRLRHENAAAKWPKKRETPEMSRHVRYKIGQPFRHQSDNYYGFIIGWDWQCEQTETWIQYMRVDELSCGRRQPFYNVIGDDKLQRYVAEENIDIMHTQPNEALMRLAGRYFKRWDTARHAFVSNMKDEYPDD